MQNLWWILKNMAWFSQSCISVALLCLLPFYFCISVGYSWIRIARWITSTSHTRLTFVTKKTKKSTYLPQLSAHYAWNRGKCRFHPAAIVIESPDVRGRNARCWTQGNRCKKEKEDVHRIDPAVLSWRDRDTDHCDAAVRVKEDDLGRYQMTQNITRHVASLKHSRRRMVRSCRSGRGW